MVPANWQHRPWRPVPQPAAGRIGWTRPLVRRAHPGCRGRAAAGPPPACAGSHRPCQTEDAQPAHRQHPHTCPTEPWQWGRHCDGLLTPGSSVAQMTSNGWPPGPCRAARKYVPQWAIGGGRGALGLLKDSWRGHALVVLRELLTSRLHRKMRSMCRPAQTHPSAQPRANEQCHQGRAKAGSELACVLTISLEAVWRALAAEVARFLKKEASCWRFGSLPACSLDSTNCSFSSRNLTSDAA